MEGWSSSYDPPGSEAELLEVWASRLLRGSRESLRFAQARLAEEGKDAAPPIARALKSIVGEGALFGAQVNCCAALGATGDRSQGDLLLKVLMNASVPVVRSSAAEALGALGDPASALILVSHARREGEEGPRRAVFRALGQLHGSASGDFLEERILAWLKRPLAVPEGETALNAILLLEDEGAVERLRRLEEHLPGPLKVKALARRASLGDGSAVAGLVPFLEAEAWPSAAVRSQAVAGLALAGAWDVVLAAASDPDIKVREAVASGLGNPGAGNLGAEQLAAWAAEGELGLRNRAVASLLLRGDSQCLEPYLSRLRSFPTGPGSLDALHVLRLNGQTDPRVVPILLARFPVCPEGYQLDIVRVLGTTASPAAVKPLEAVARDSDSREELRIAALSGLGNLGRPSAVSAILELEGAYSGFSWEEAWVSALGRNAGIPVAKERLVSLLADASAPDARRRGVMETLPLVLGRDAWAPLLEARNLEKRPEVQAFLNSILKKYF